MSRKSKYRTEYSNLHGTVKERLTTFLASLVSESLDLKRAGEKSLTCPALPMREAIVMGVYWEFGTMKTDFPNLQSVRIRLGQMIAIVGIEDSPENVDRNKRDPQILVGALLGMGYDD